MSPFAPPIYQEIRKNKDMEFKTFIAGRGLSLLIFSSKKRGFPYWEVKSKSSFNCNLSCGSRDLSGVCNLKKKSWL